MGRAQPGSLLWAHVRPLGQGPGGGHAARLWGGAPRGGGREDGSVTEMQACLTLEGTRVLPGASPVKALTPFMRTPPCDLITSPRPHLWVNLLGS